MEITTENTAADDVMQYQDLGVKQMNFHEETMYQITMCFARKMYDEGLISKDEYRQIDTIFREKYKPKFGTLFVDLP